MLSTGILFAPPLRSPSQDRQVCIAHDFRHELFAACPSTRFAPYGIVIAPAPAPEGRVKCTDLHPIVLGAIFYGMFTPVAAVMRIIGRDAMRRRFEPASRTYWIERSPTGS